MEIITQNIAPFILMVAGMFGFGEYQNAPAAEVADSTASVELNLQETSPKGREGGYAIPASGCSPVSSVVGHNPPTPIHDCATLPDISVDEPIIRLGDTTVVRWDPKIHTNCILSVNLGSLEVTVPGNSPVTPTGETSYSILCDGAGNFDSVTVKVLPRIQET